MSSPGILLKPMMRSYFFGLVKVFIWWANSLMSSWLVFLLVVILWSVSQFGLSPSQEVV